MLNASDSRMDRYLWGLGSGYVAVFLTMMVGLWLTPFILGFLDREEFAIFTLCNDVLMWLALADLGIAAWVRMKAAQLTGKPDQEKMNRLASTGFFGELGIGVLVGVVGVAIAVAFPDFFNVRADLRQDAVNVVALFGMGLAVRISLQTFSALLVAHQQIHVDNAVRIGLLVIRTTLTVVFLSMGWRMYSLAAAQIVAVVLSAAVAALRCFRSLPGLQIQPGLVTWPEFKDIVSNGLWFTVGGVAGILILGMDRVLTARVVDLAAVTTLSLTGRLYMLGSRVIQQITNTARPALGQLIAQGDSGAAFKSFERIAVISTGLAVVTGMSIWAGNSLFVSWWVGEENYGGVGLDLALAANLMVNCWVLPYRAVLAAGLVVKPQSICRLIEGLVNLVISVALGIYFGLAGVILGTAIASVATSFWYLPLLASRLFKIPVLRMWKANLVQIRWVLALQVAVSASIWALVNHRIGFTFASGAMFVSAFIGSFLLWHIGFNASMRQFFKNEFFARLNRTS